MLHSRKKVFMNVHVMTEKSHIDDAF